MVPNVNQVRIFTPFFHLHIFCHNILQNKHIWNVQVIVKEKGNRSLPFEVASYGVHDEKAGSHSSDGKKSVRTGHGDHWSQ